MTPALFLGVCLAGGLGALLRYVTDSAVNARLGATYPVGTMVINLSGAFVLGLITGLVTRGIWPAPVASVLGTGLMGGYTTFSTAMWESLTLARAGRRAAWIHTVVMLLGGYALALAGMALASL